MAIALKSDFPTIPETGGEMSTYLYLSEDILEKIPDCEPDQKAYTLGVLKLKRDEDGRLIYQIQNDRSPLALRIPIALREYVIAVSMIRRFPDDPIRIFGVYQYLEARATVDILRDGDPWIMVHVIGKDLENVAQLYGRIRAGTIEPTESWERLQPGTESEYDQHQDELDLGRWVDPRLTKNHLPN